MTKKDKEYNIQLARHVSDKIRDFDDGIIEKMVNKNPEAQKLIKKRDDYWKQHPIVSERKYARIQNKCLKKLIKIINKGITQKETDMICEKISKEFTKEEIIELDKYQKDKQFWVDNINDL